VLTLFYDIQSLLVRYLTKLVRNPTLLVTNIGTPVLLLLLFSQLLQKLSIFPGVSGSYLTYLTPGVVVLTALNASPLSGISIANDLNSGFLSKMLLTRINRPAILLGRLLTDILVVLAQSIIILAIAIAMGVTIVTGLLGVLLILVTAAFFELALSGIFLVVAIRTRKTETISSLQFAFSISLLFISSALFPTAFFPAWAQTVSKYNPVSYASNVIRALVQGGLTWSTIVSAYAVIGFIALVTIAATLYQFRKVIS
jgi:ABC-2 type transport system permease protein